MYVLAGSPIILAASSGEAIERGVLPSLSCWSTSAPLSIRNMAISPLSLWAAQCSGPMFCEAPCSRMLAPLLTRAFTRSSCPALAARKSGVIPVCVCVWDVGCVCVCGCVGEIRYQVCLHIHVAWVVCVWVCMCVCVLSERTAKLKCWIMYKYLLGQWMAFCLSWQENISTLLVIDW